MRINRLIEMIMILINKEQVTVKYLSDHFGVSRKTIYGDLDILLTSGIPVSYGDNHKGLVRIVAGFDFHSKYRVSNDSKEVKDVTYYKKYVNNEEHIKELVKDWEYFKSNRLDEANKTINSTIFHSWIRSQNAGVPVYAVDSDNIVKPEFLNQYNLKSLVQEDDVQLFCALIESIGWYVCIYDTQNKLNYIINPINQYERLFPHIGYSKDASESKIGTNASVIAMLDEKPTLLYGPENYSKALHETSIVAVPIYENQLLSGTFVVVFLHQNVNKDIVPLATAMTRLYENMVLNYHGVNQENEAILYGHGPRFFDKDQVKLYGRSKQWFDIINLANNLSILDQDFIIFGEKGVGKETLARYIHQHSARNYGPCLTIDFNQITVKEQKKIIFGMENGESGLIEDCQGGLLIIKNIGSVAPVLKKGFYEFLKNKRMRRIGSKKYRKYDIRVCLCMISYNPQGIEDVIPLAGLNMPPLRKRKEDVFAIVENYMVNYFKEHQYSKRDVREFIDDIDESIINGNAKSLISHLDKKMKL